eukprot:scaffold110358_cov66-Cyclotella_meneghiniana.AAC.1
MGRSKTQPRRQPTSATIVGTAAHAAASPSILPCQESNGAVVTPPKQEAKRRRGKLKKDRHQQGTEEEEDGDVFFDEDVPTKRIKFTDDADATSSVRRRVIFEDEEESDDTASTKNDILTIIDPTQNGDFITIIHVPSSHVHRHEFPSNSFELMHYHLPNTKIVIIDSSTSAASPNLDRHDSITEAQYGAGEKITLTNKCSLETLLQYCNTALAVNKAATDTTIDIKSILKAVEHDVLAITLSSTNSATILSIHLLQVNSLIHSNSKMKILCPSILTPRVLRQSKKNISNPAYITIQALGGMYPGSILDDVAKSCRVNETITQQTRSNESITAGMVYSVVDNVHYNTMHEIAQQEQPLDIPCLVPKLRPYQEAAVRWMLQRETDSSSELLSEEWELCWYVIVQQDTDECDLCDSKSSRQEITAMKCKIIPLTVWKNNAKSSQDDEYVLCNPFTSQVAITYDDAKYLTLGTSKTVYHNKGGILAESMGLGKTVEVIACILANPSPLLDNTVANVGNNNVQSQSQSYDHAEEAIRIYQSKTIIESRATLIVTPPSILTQWEREIAQHTRHPLTGKPLKVIIYPGVKELCDSRSSSKELMNPRVLADADVVLVSFQVLNNDIGHSDDNPYTASNRASGSSRLRHAKRHVVLPSPLCSIKFHRVCLDEAQRIEAPTTSSARMARKLITDKRWCVSGTPIGRHNLNDLYGLFLFLSFGPFDEKDWMQTLVPSQGDAMKRLSHLLKKVMWRSTKQNSNVREQMGIPEQVEKKVLLKFTSIEKHWYERQYQEAVGSIKHWSDAGRLDKLHHELNKLRAACCHPQVGASGIGGRGVNKILSMEEILIKLIEDSKVRCEEAQRIAVLHTNGMACLSRLKSECEESDEAKKMLMARSLKTYQSAIDLMDESAEPTMLLGKAILSGSIGFRLSDKVVNCDALRVDWQMKCIKEAWSDFNFTTSKRVSCVKIRPRWTLPDDIDSSWAVLQPQKCILQMSSAPDGGCFVDVGSVLLTANGVEENSCKEISGSRGKSKAYRLVIKSYHPIPSTSLMQPSNYYVGLDLEFFEPKISDDPLQRLHTLHNSSDVLSSMLQDTNVQTGNFNYETETARLKKIEDEAQTIHDSYMARAQAVHRQKQLNLSTFKLAREKCEEELNDLSNDSERDWYEDILGWLAIYGSAGQQREMVEAVKSELESYFGNMIAERTGIQELSQIMIRSGRFPTFNNISGLHAALQLRIQQDRDTIGFNVAKECLETIAKLPGSPSTGEVIENSHCQRCREDWEQTGPTCKHCLLEDDLNNVEKHFNDPEISCVLKAIRKVVEDQVGKSYGRHKSYMRIIQRRAAKHTELQRLVREEIKAAKSFWRAHFDLLSDIDELNQCKRAMRLRRDGECVFTD